MTNLFRTSLFLSIVAVLSACAGGGRGMAPASGSATQASAANTVSNVIHLDPSLFGLNDGPQVARYTAGNKAVIALSPDAGAVGAPGEAPINFVFDLATGAQSQFTGFNNGFYGSGDVNGIAVDPNTGIEATTTELNAQVEFYDVTRQTGITTAQLPCTGDTSQYFSGAGIAVDPF